MKDKVFNNIIFISLITLLLVFSLKCFLISFGIIKIEYLLTMFNEWLYLIYSNSIYQAIFALIGLFIFLIALYLIWLNQKIGQPLPHVKVSTDSGEIRISTYSLEQIVLNVLNKVEGVRKIKPKIEIQKNEDIKTILALVIDKNCNIPHTASLIQQKLKEELPKISGVKVKEVKINVDKIEYD